MLPFRCFPQYSTDEKVNNVEKEELLKTLSNLISKVNNQEHIDDPANLFFNMVKIYQRITYIQDQHCYSLYGILTYISKHHYKKTTLSSNMILTDLVESIYNDRRVDFSRYDYVTDIESDYRQNNIKLIDFNVKFTGVKNFINKEYDLIRLLRHNGIQGTLTVLKLLLTKVYVEYGNINYLNKNKKS